MNVQLHKNFYITGDSMNVILEERTGRFTTLNKGKENEEEREIVKNHGYFGTVEGALQKFVKIKIADSPANSIAELIQEVQSLKNLIKEKVTF